MGNKSDRTGAINRARGQFWGVYVSYDAVIAAGFQIMTDGLRVVRYAKLNGM